MRALAFGSVLLSGCAAWSSMDRTDIALEATHALVTAADAATTYAAVNDCTESNPIIGRCGKSMPVPLYFGLYLAVHMAAVLALPPGRVRTVLQGITIGTEGHAAYRNAVVHPWVPPLPPGHP